MDATARADLDDVEHDAAIIHDHPPVADTKANERMPSLQGDDVVDQALRVGRILLDLAPDPPGLVGRDAAQGLQGKWAIGATAFIGHLIADSRLLCAKNVR